MSYPSRSSGLRHAIAAGLAACLMVAHPVLAAPTGADDAPAEVGSVLVRLQPGVPLSSAAGIAKDHGLRLLEHVEGTGFLLFSAGTHPMDAVARELAADGRIETAEPNHVRQVAAVPNDPHVAGSQAAYLDLIRLPEAWDLTTGADDLTLAVVDSGVNADHPDLAGRLLPGRDFVNDDNDPDDDLGHGTQVATVAAATGNDGRGMAGVAWRGKVLPVKVIDAQGNTTDADAAAGIRWAVDQGADVVNLSFGGVQSAPKVVKEAVQHARDRDVVVVAAAGNGGRTHPIYPAALEGVIAVAASDHSGGLATFSDSGPWIDVAAPGVDMLVGWRDGGYRVNSGTSFAAPVVAGVAMLARAHFPGDNADEIARRIQLGAADTGPLGPDDIYGYGVVDAAGTLSGGSRRLPLDATLMAHEPDNAPDRATPLFVGGSASAHFAPEQDLDWYSVDITSPRRHTFTVGPASGGSRMDPVLAVFDPELRLLEQFGGDRNGEAKVTLYTATPGRYYVRVQSRTATSGPGPYRVGIASQDGPAQIHFKTYSRNYVDLLGGSTVAIADLTGDGATDLLMSRAAPAAGADHNDLILMPRADTEYKPVMIPMSRKGSTADLGLAVLDVDDDGDDDAVLATAGGLEVYHQIDGTLRRTTLMATSGAATQVEAGDINGDGLPDLVAARAAGGIAVLLNEGRAVFGAPLAIGSARTAEIEAGDLDGDGRHEIVALECDPTCRTVATYRSGADGFSRSDTRISVDEPCGQSGALGIGNVMGDGRLDVFASCAGVDGVYVLTLDGTGTLSRRPRLGLGYTHAPVALESADIDGDGRDEIISLHDNSEYAYALWITPDGDSVGDVFDLGRIAQERHGPKGLAVGDINGDRRPDLAIAGWDYALSWLTITPAVPMPVFGRDIWIRDTIPAAGSTDVAADATVTLRFAPTLEPTSVTTDTVRLGDAYTGAAVPASVTYDGASNSAVIRPEAALIPGHTYQVTTRDLTGTSGTIPETECCYRFAVRQPGNERPSTPVQPVGTASKPPPPTPVRATGYWMLDAAGTVYHFGDAAGFGDATAGAVDLEPTPTGKGYWALNRSGLVSNFGDATSLGNVDPSRLAKDEHAASLSATPSGKGYWVFTNRGRAIAFGDAAHLGDMSQTKLNGPVLGSVATPSGQGYYMVASDGGIFAFGDAAFAGSMGGTKLNAPVQSLVPDSDGQGYWLVASDGGIFAFGAPFRGSLGATRLNKPVVGMVRYGDGYLMVGADGGIFNFSSLPFAGSLGARPPASPVVGVAALPTS